MMHKAEPPQIRNQPRKLNSEQLFGSQRKIIICHHGVDYQLRITGNDKLILTK